MRVSKITLRMRANIAVGAVASAVDALWKIEISTAA
jgi:hypothetical protein